MTTATLSSNRLAEFGKGFKAALPIVCGLVPVSFAFGLLAIKIGITPVGAIAMSFFLFAGSGQFIAVSILGEASWTISSLLLTLFIVNLRHMLMSVALVLHIGHWSLIKRLLFAFELTDETFAMHFSRYSQPVKPSDISTFALNHTTHAAWILGTVMGVFMGEYIPDEKVFGLDFALVGMFIALLIPIFEKGKAFVLAGALSAGLSVGLALLGVSTWNVIIATLIAATIACFFLTKEKTAK